MTPEQVGTNAATLFIGILFIAVLPMIAYLFNEALKEIFYIVRKPFKRHKLRKFYNLK